MKNERIIKVDRVCSFALIQKPPLFLHDFTLFKLVIAFLCCSIDYRSQKRQFAGSRMPFT